MTSHEAHVPAKPVLDGLAGTWLRRWKSSAPRWARPRLVWCEDSAAPAADGADLVVAAES